MVEEVVIDSIHTLLSRVDLVVISLLSAIHTPDGFLAPQEPSPR